MESVQRRRLAAVAIADVVGYTRLMQEDEAGTLAALTELRRSIIEPMVTAHGGRVVKLMGDAVLLEFASAVDAVAGALKLQRDLLAANRARPEDRRLEMRIGINLGDVIGDGDDIYGDGVNIASRLQTLAPPGGVCLSAKVHEEVRGKVDQDFDDAGDQVLKNVATPVRVFLAGAAPKAPGSKTASAKISIAVLPFMDLIGEAVVHPVTLGLAEDIITELSRLRILRVIARNSSSRFQGAGLDMVKVGRELDAHFLVEGSIRRTGAQLRVTVQLIDAASGDHVWAEKYDRPEAAFGEAQDELIRTVVTTLIGRLQNATVEQVGQRPIGALAAAECVLRAEGISWQNRSGIDEARALCHQAIKLDTSCARGYAVLAALDYREWLSDLNALDATLERGVEQARKAAELDSNDGYCHLILAQVYLYSRRYDLAERHHRRAIALNPNRPGTYAGLAHYLHYTGNPQGGLEQLALIRKIDPFFEPSWFWASHVIMHYAAQKYEEALTAFRRIDEPLDWVVAYAAASAAMAGDAATAQRHVHECLAITPDLTIAKILRRDPFQHDADRLHVMDGMKSAGVPAT